MANDRQLDGAMVALYAKVPGLIPNLVKLLQDITGATRTEVQMYLLALRKDQRRMIQIQSRIEERRGRAATGSAEKS